MPHRKGKRRLPFFISVVRNDNDINNNSNPELTKKNKEVNHYYDNDGNVYLCERLSAYYATCTVELLHVRLDRLNKILCAPLKCLIILSSYTYLNKMRK